jgi:hypothetical protein
VIYGVGILVLGLIMSATSALCRGGVRYHQVRENGQWVQHARWDDWFLAGAVIELLGLAVTVACAIHR